MVLTQRLRKQTSLRQPEVAVLPNPVILLSPSRCFSFVFLKCAAELGLGECISLQWKRQSEDVIAAMPKRTQGLYLARWGIWEYS